MSIEPRGAQHPREQSLDGDEAHGVAALEPGQADGHGEVGLAQPGGADETQGPALGDEALIEVAEEELAIELGADAEVKVVHRSLEGEGLRRRRGSWLSSRQPLLLEQPRRKLG